MVSEIEKYSFSASRASLLAKLSTLQTFRVAVGKSKWVQYEGFRQDYNLREILKNEVVIEFDTLQQKRAWFGTHETCINLLNAGYNFEVWDHGGKSPHIHVRGLPIGSLDGDNLRQFKKIFIRKYVPQEYLDVVDYSLTGIHLIALEYQFHWKGCYGYKILLTKFGDDEMGSIAQEAQEYQPRTTKNITDLEIVSTDVNVEDRTGKNNDGDEFSYKVVVIEGEEYRVPLTVLASLKEILAKKPDLKSFSVSKSGQGLETRYTVIPQV